MTSFLAREHGNQVLLPSISFSSIFARENEQPVSLNILY